MSKLPKAIKGLKPTVIPAQAPICQYSSGNNACGHDEDCEDEEHYITRNEVWPHVERVDEIGSHARWRERSRLYLSLRAHCVRVCEDRKERLSIFHEM